MWILNPKRVYRLYKKMGLKSLLPGPHTSKSNPKATYKFAYLLKKLSIERKNQVWASDITYVPMGAGYMFLYAIIDLYSRFITGWGLSNTMTAEWCTVITREALYQWGKPEIFNTDRGRLVKELNLPRTASYTCFRDRKSKLVWTDREEP